MTREMSRRLYLLHVYDPELHVDSGVDEGVVSNLVGGDNICFRLGPCSNGSIFRTEAKLCLLRV